MKNTARSHLLIFPLVVISTVNAQIEILDAGSAGNGTTINDIYTQNFDTLPVSDFDSPWVNNSTLAGWYSTSGQIRSGVPGGLLSSGDTGGSDRALGASGSLASDVFFALRMSNASSSTISGVTVNFDGEQWYRKQNTPQVLANLALSYKIFDGPHNGSNLRGTDWVNVDDLNFVSPNATDPTFAVLDGNAPENSVQDIHSMITGITLAPGQEIWLRWGSVGIPARVRAHDLAIDNLSVSFTTIPEPATFAAFLGAGVLLATLRHRRRTR